MKWKLNIYGLAKESEKGELCGHTLVYNIQSLGNVNAALKRHKLAG